MIIVISQRGKLLEVRLTSKLDGILGRNGTQWNPLVLEILGASVGEVTSIQVEKDQSQDTTSVVLSVDMFTDGLLRPTAPRVVRFLAEDSPATIVGKAVAGLGQEVQKRVR